MELKTKIELIWKADTHRVVAADSARIVLSQTARLDLASIADLTSSNDNAFVLSRFRDLIEETELN